MDATQSRSKTANRGTWINGTRHDSLEMEFTIRCVPGRGWCLVSNGGIEPISPLFANQASLCDYLNNLLSHLCSDCARDLRRIEIGLCSDCLEDRNAEHKRDAAELASREAAHDDAAHRGEAEEIAIESALEDRREEQAANGRFGVGA